MPAAGRFAPSPSGALHLGNLRTAALAWLFARSAGRGFLLRVEDLDSQRSRRQHEATQLADLRAIGVEWDAEPIRQSARSAAYAEALSELVAGGHTFECYCSRREIRDAQSAPHAGALTYPGTCHDLSATERARRRAAGRTATIRLRGGQLRRWSDLVAGDSVATADDAVLQRADGAFAYNLAVVVDDVWQSVGQIVRGDDLLEQTATQILLTELLSGSASSVEYGHVPLVLNRAGQRLAKRDGAVSLGELARHGVSAADAVRLILSSLGDAVPSDAVTLTEAVTGFDGSLLPRDAWVFDPPR